MKKSIIRKLQFAMYGFGILMGAIFPFYAALFDAYGGSKNIYFRIGCYGAGLMIGLFCFALVKFSILKELKKINVLAEALKNGDLTVSISTDSHDELGDIVNNLSRSTTSMRELISTILGTSDKILTSLKQLRAFSINMNGAANDINDRSHDMIATVGRIENNSESISDAVRGTAESVSMVSEDLTALTDFLMKVDKSCVEEMAVTGRVNEKFSETRDSINELAENSDEISGIAEIIKSIADQTNLLAINAAVEAAVAGQYGKSFAVVAKEVKNLADQSLKSAQEISNLVDRIRPIIETSRESMISSTEEMTLLTKLATEISEATSSEVTLLQEISQKLSRSNESMQNVTGALQENSVGISDSSGKLRMVNGAIESISRDIEEGSVNILSLEKRAAELSRLTHQFKVS